MSCANAKHGIVTAPLHSKFIALLSPQPYMCTLVYPRRFSEAAIGALDETYQRVHEATEMTHEATGEWSARKTCKRVADDSSRMFPSAEPAKNRRCNNPKHLKPTKANGFPT